MEIYQEDFIHLKDYLDICKEQGIEEEEKAFFISAFLHDIGVILHYQDNPRLKNCVILNPHWATEAVYLILFDEKIIEQAGEFDVTDIERIWKDAKYRYKHADLLELMIKFELCYELEKDKKYIIPELLANKIPDKGYPESFNESSVTELLHFEYRYNFMPKGIISRLIVRMNQYIYKKLQWKSGVILDYENTFAEVKGHHDERKLKIRIYGDHKKELLAIIRNRVDSIHKSFEKLNFNEMIPCTCSECKKESIPHFYKYSLLQKYQIKGRKIIVCDNSLIDVKVGDLLKGVIMQKWDVFISYSSKDSEIIHEIVNTFKNNNISYWLDDEQIKPGDRIISKIEIGLENSQYIMPCFSQNQQKSGWSKAEYESILHEIFSNKTSNRKVIPLVLDDIEIPWLTKDIAYITYSDSKSYQKLLNFLKDKHR